jgi:hypothetical protein
MKRRKAIGRILLAGGATAAAYGGYEWVSLNNAPDVEFLLTQSALLAALAETIIPATDTPGATEAGVVQFMIPLLIQCTERKTLNRFLQGLRDLEAYSHSRYQKDFLHCSNTEREGIVRYFENRSATGNRRLNRLKNNLWGASFFETLKKYSVESYCISEKGATLALHYIPVPGRYDACAAMEPNQRAWATN